MALSYQDFRRLRMDASECDSIELFLAEEGGSVFYDDIEKLLFDFNAIYNVKTMKDVRELTELSQLKFAFEYNLSPSDIEKWESGESVCPKKELEKTLFLALSDLLYR